MIRRRNFLIAGSLLASKIAFAKAEEFAAKKSVKTVLVTGGTSGIGEASVRFLASKGYQVAFCGRRKELGKKIESELASTGGRVLFIPCDIREADQVENFVTESIKAYKKIDCLFANAGIGHYPTEMHTLKREVVKNVFETNYWGTLNSILAILPHMMRNESGTIILNTSFSVNHVISGESIYASSKIALEALVNHMSNEYAKYNIRTVSIQPLKVKTLALENFLKTIKQPLKLLENNVLGRTVEPIEIAQVVEQLLMLETPIISGSHIDLSAGQWR